MHTLKRLGFIGLVGGAMFLSACGAKQKGSKALHADWKELYAAVPADAAWNFGVRVDADSSMPKILEMAQGSFSPDAFTGIVNVLKRENMLNDKELVAFERDGSRWLIVNVDQPALALEKLADHFRMVGGVEETRVGERVLLRHVLSGERNEGYAVDATAVGQFVIARYSDSSSEREVNAEFVQLTTGWPGVGTFAKSGPGEAQRARAAGGTLTSWGGLNVRALNEGMRTEAAAGNDMLEMVRTSEVDTSVACQEANARIEALVPSVTFVSFTDEAGLEHTDAFMELSARGVDRGNRLMRGAPSLQRFTERALLGVGASFDYGTFLRELDPAEGQSACYGLAGVVGVLDEMKDDYSTSIQFNARTVSGTGAFVLESVNLDGFIPTAELGVMVHSPNATALMDRLVRFASKHGTASVIATASSPAVSVQLSGVPLRIRIQSGEDRVVISTGGVHEEITTGLMNVGVHASDAPALEIFTDGTRMARLVEQANIFIEDMEMPEDDSTRDVVEMLSGQTKSVRASLRFEANGLRFSSRQE